MGRGAWKFMSRPTRMMAHEVGLHRQTENGDSFNFEYDHISNHGVGAKPIRIAFVDGHRNLGLETDPGLSAFQSHAFGIH